MQPRPFEEWIENGHQRDANLCGAYARPINEQMAMGWRGVGGDYVGVKCEVRLHVRVL